MSKILEKMPYYARKGYRRAPMRKTKTRKQPSKSAAVKKNFTTIPKKVPRFVIRGGPELKRLIGEDVNLTVPVGSNFTVPGCMTLLAEGTGINQRVGRKVTYKSIEIRWTFYPGTPTAGQTPHSEVRIVMFYDKDQNGTQTPIAAVLHPAANFNSPLRQENFGERFILLHDQISKLSTASDDADRMVPVSGVIRVPCHLDSQFQGGTNTITDVSSGGISIMVAGNSLAAGASVGAFVFTGIFEYNDV